MTLDPDKLQGRARGGAIVAAKLTPQERIERARKGALARWGEKPLQAIRKGNFQKDFGIDVECYVLDDLGKTAVISQRGMGQAIGLKDSSGQALTRFVEGKSIAPHLGAELLEKLDKPLIFNSVLPGAKLPPAVGHGYDVTILIDVCKAIVKAEADGKLRTSQANIAKQAHIVLNASAKAGIKGLVYALAGYNPSTEEVIAAFKVYVREEAKKYEQEFPNELYMAWHRLYKIPIPARGKPWQFLHLTRRHVYYPLAKSNGKVYELLKALKAKDGDQNKKLFQFLNDIGARALRMQLGRVLEMAESSVDDPILYESKVAERFGDQRELDLVLPPQQ